MKNILIACSLVFFLHSSLFGQSKYDDPKSLPYNCQPHSVKYHSGIIAAHYWIAYSLKRKEAMKIKHAVRSFYQNSTERDKTGELLHIWLQQKLKGILTWEQYERYKKMELPAELFFSGGAPA
jgi:hypothetical protein